MDFRTKTVVIGICGGIAAFKIKELITAFKKLGIKVFVIMTDNATKMISPDEFENLTGNKVYRYLFSKDFDYKEILEKREVDHIQLADKADLFLVAPATANIIAKMAHGIADDFLATTLLATKAPILIFPSMNVNMWHNPTTQENVHKLKGRGYQIINPDSGLLACGYEGAGRLTDITKIFDESLRLLKRNELLKGERILVTAGGTMEKIDDVRFILNKSSGKMGVAIAESCYLRGAKVILLRSKTSVIPRFQIEQHEFETADELAELVKKYSPDSDICFHAAAVSDFKPTAWDGKIPSEKAVTIRLKKRDKIYTYIKKANPKINLIAFKAEWQKTDKELVIEAREKLKKTPIDILVINDVGKPNQGINEDTNEVIVVSKNGKSKKFSHKSKREIADEVVDYILTK